jgi:endo-1,4-beta-mannosidase
MRKESPRQANRLGSFLVLMIGVLFVVPILPLAENIFLTKPAPAFMWNGEPFRPVGFNYYPRTHPWAGTWTAFNGTELRADLQTIKSLGGNCIRTFIQWRLIEPQPGTYNSTIVDRIIQLFDIASDEEIAIQFAFFDWGLSGAWPDEAIGDRFTNQTMINHQIAQLQYVIPLLKNKSAAFIWDLTNEPGGEDLGKADFRNWVQQLSDSIRFIDNAHYITVGGAQWQNWDPIGYADLLDAVCLHYYRSASMIEEHRNWIPDYANQLQMFTKSGKPVIVQEFGISNEQFSEELAADYLKDIFTISDQYGVAGIMPWCFWDYGPDFQGSQREARFGFLGFDGTWKPVAQMFRSYTLGTFSYTNGYSSDW